MLGPAAATTEAEVDASVADPAVDEQDTVPRKSALTRSGNAWLRGFIGVV
jgi:hypothetical protein